MSEETRNEVLRSLKIRLVNNFKLADKANNDIIYQAFALISHDLQSNIDNLTISGSTSGDIDGGDADSVYLVEDDIDGEGA